MELETDLGTYHIKSEYELRKHLTALDLQTNTRAILSTGEQSYMQCAVVANGYIIERRDGSAATHERATYAEDRKPLPMPDGAKQSWWQKLLGLNLAPAEHDDTFTQEEMIATFESHLGGKPNPSYIRWVSAEF